jgi:hypothetical protein
MTPDSSVLLKSNTDLSANRLQLPRDPETLRLQSPGHPSTFDSISDLIHLLFGSLISFTFIHTNLHLYRLVPISTSLLLGLLRHESFRCLVIPKWTSR